MTQFLCISARFLDRRFHGKGDRKPEWPPSPMRLYQALLAGTKTGCRIMKWSSAKKKAFLWLANQDPPVVIGPTVTLGSPQKFFVPRNDSDKIPDRQGRLTGRTIQPVHLCNDNPIHYLWPINKSNKEELAIVNELAKEARNLLSLGLGIDMIVGFGRIISNAEVAAIPGKRWHPWLKPGPQGWRTPTAGSLENLIEVHHSFQQRLDGNRYTPPLKLNQFDTVDYISAKIMPPRFYAKFELPDGVAFRQEDAAKVATMLRALAISQAKKDTHDFPGGSETYVAGHTGTSKETPPRFSYLPLPTIGHSHSDGMIRRLLIAEPFGADGNHANWAQNRLRSSHLIDIDNNERGVLSDLWRPTSGKMIERYVASSSVWQSVTPVVLPGRDDGKHAKAVKLLYTAIGQANIPTEAISELTLQRAPFWQGSQHPRHYFVPKYLKKGQARWHVKLTFHEPISGPLSIGAGRHLGLGIFAGCHKNMDSFE